MMNEKYIPIFAVLCIIEFILFCFVEIALKEPNHIDRIIGCVLIAFMLIIAPAVIKYAKLICKTNKEYKRNGIN